MRRGLIGVAVTALLAVATLGLGAGTAAAVTNPYTPTQVCGSSYSVLDSMPVKTNSGATWGRVYLLWSSSAQKNCVVTLKSSFVGVSTHTMAYADAQNGNGALAEGNYSYYAYDTVYAPNSCVMYGGYIYSGTSTNTSNYAYAGSDWGWC
ncbi:MAG TPA: hypothetical protein VM677_21985 [Actinokineospora sp.]|nr:hypothetical protein [Actinokineospora sp.]